MGEPVGILVNYVEKDRRAMRVVFAGLVAIVALVGLHQLTGTGPSFGPAGSSLSPVVSENTVLLTGDLRDGTTIEHLGTGETLHFANGKGGFLETLATVIRRSRLTANADQSAPIVARLHEGGGVSIFDPETRRVISLASYGHDNIAFLRDQLLAASMTTSDAEKEV